MSSKTLSIGTIELVDTEAKLMLSVKATVDISVQDANQHAAFQLTRDKIELRRIWISRGVPCCLKIEILFNGKPLTMGQHARILEGIGCHIRDAKFWSVLSLSTSLTIPQVAINSHETILSLNLTENTNSTSANFESPSLVHRNVGLMVPPSVFCAKLEVVHIQFNFRSINDEPAHVAKRIKNVHNLPDVMPLTPNLKSQQHSHLEVDQLEAAVSSLRNLPVLMTKCFIPHRKPPIRFPLYMSTPSSDSFVNRQEVYLQKHIHDVLETWLLNVDKTQIDKCDTRGLMEQTGFTERQITLFLNYHGKGILKGHTEDDGEMLFTSAPSTTSFDDMLRQEEMMLFEEKERQDDGKGVQYERIPTITDPETPYPGTNSDDEMLFLQSSVTLTHQYARIPATNNSISSIRSRETPQKRILLTNISNDISKSANILSTLPALNLTDAALRTLIIGHIPGPQTISKAIMTKKPLPITSLSKIAPSLFSPGYYRSIAQHSKYLPTISRSISNSMLYKVQSPTLKEKLSKLAGLAHLPTPSPNHTDVALTESERLSSAIQSRVWHMMQRILFDGLAARRLWDAPSGKEALDVTDDFTDLLWESSTMYNLVDRGTSSDSEFDDILGDEENDEFSNDLKWSAKFGKEDDLEEILLQNPLCQEVTEY